MEIVCNQTYSINEEIKDQESVITVNVTFSDQEYTSTLKHKLFATGESQFKNKQNIN